MDIGKANDFEEDNFEWLFDCEFVLFLEWFHENIQEMNVLSPDELNRSVHLLFSGLTFVLRDVNLGNWSLLVCAKRTHLFSPPGVGVGRLVIEDTTAACLINFTDKILWPLKFVYTNILSKSRHFLIKQEVRFNARHFLLLDRGVAMQY